MASTSDTAHGNKRWLKLLLIKRCSIRGCNYATVGFIVHDPAQRSNGLRHIFEAMDKECAVGHRDRSL